MSVLQTALAWLPLQPRARSALSLPPSLLSGEIKPSLMSDQGRGPTLHRPGSTGPRDVILRARVAESSLSTGRCPSTPVRADFAHGHDPALIQLKPAKNQPLPSSLSTLCLCVCVCVCVYSLNKLFIICNILPKKSNSYNFYFWYRYK